MSTTRSSCHNHLLHIRLDHLTGRHGQLNGNTTAQPVHLILANISKYYSCNSMKERARHLHVRPRHDLLGFTKMMIRFACCCYLHRPRGPSFSQAADGYDAYYLAAGGACACSIIACCRRFNGVHSSWMNCYGIPVGCHVAFFPPRVHAETVETVASWSRSQGPQMALISSAWCLCILYSI